MGAGPVTLVSDVIVPSIFTPYVQQISAEKSAFIQSGVAVRDAQLDALLAGGGKIFDIPSFKDLDQDVERVSNDVTGGNFSGAATPNPFKTGTSQETGVRLSRNASWSNTDLVQALAGKDPMQSVAQLVGSYWMKRGQKTLIATLAGVFADNAAAPSASEHVLNDLTVDVSGVSFIDGVTNFNAEVFIDAQQTMGDSSEDLGAVCVHSAVYARMKKNNLIDFRSDATNPDAAAVPFFLGKRVIQDDGMPRTGAVYESWLFAPGAVRMGMGAPKVPTEVERIPGGGNGGGQEVLYSRVEWMFHPVGHRYVGTSPNGGPSNLATSNNLAHADSWARVFPERKQIRIARLITREA